MNISNYYWYFTSAIPPRICDDIIKYGLSQAETMARTGGYDNRELTKKEIKDIKRKRNSDVVWLNDRWIYKEIQPYVDQANKNAGWNFDFDISESCQFTKYKLNQYYDWHRDSWNEPYEKPEDLNYHGKIRKLSVSCLLSDPKDYKGGDLEFAIMDKEPNKKPDIIKLKSLKKGSIVVFPSFLWHRVKPVTKGIRYSLVIWNCGYPFK